MRTREIAALARAAYARGTVWATHAEGMIAVWEALREARLDDTVRIVEGTPVPYSATVYRVRPSRGFTVAVCTLGA